MGSAKIKFTSFILLIAFCFFIVTCKHEMPKPVDNGGGNDTSVQTNTCSPDTVYFENEIFPLITSNCTTSGCHDSHSHAGGVNLTSYAKIMNYVVPFKPQKSELYQKVTEKGRSRMPPPPAPALTADQITELETWINQGALDNQCTGDCDTSIYTYSGAVSPTIDTYCKGCHNASNAGGGIDLSTYNLVKIQAINGNLMGGITQSSGYSPMPKGGNKLSDCQIKQIQKWIDAGEPNN